MAVWPRRVVALKNNLFLVPADGGQAFADAGDHFIEAADVDVDVELQF
jgi:hypothetical protein